MNKSVIPFSCRLGHLYICSERKGYRGQTCSCGKWLEHPDI